MVTNGHKLRENGNWREKEENLKWTFFFVVVVVVAVDVVVVSLKIYLQLNTLQCTTKIDLYKWEKSWGKCTSWQGAKK